MKTFAIFDSATNHLISLFSANDGDGLDVSDYANLAEASANIDCYVINQENMSFDMRDDHEQYAQELLENNIRNRRNILLLQSDWTQNPDVNVDRKAWADYREELRNVTKQPGFPNNVVWPIPPT